MKKQLLVISVAAAIAAPAAMADVTAYGRIHVSGDSNSATSTAGKETKTTLPNMSSARSTSLGLKGSMDSNIPDAKVVFQGEIGIDGNTNDTVYSPGVTADSAAYSKSDHGAKAGFIWMRDVYAGLSHNAFGTVRGGIMTHSYKETHAAIDPLMTTALEARGKDGLQMLSGISNGYAADGGSMVGSVRYDSPSFAGAKVIAQVSKDTVAKNWVVGARYGMGPVSVWFDYINDGSVTKKGGVTEGNSMIIAAKLSMAGVGLTGAYEKDGGKINNATENSTSGKSALTDITYLSADYTMGNMMIIGSYSMKADSDAAKDGSSSWRLALKYAAAKGTDLYVGYGARTANDSNVGYSVTAGDGSKVTAKSNSVFTVGLSTKF